MRQPWARQEEGRPQQKQDGEKSDSVWLVGRGRLGLVPVLDTCLRNFNFILLSFLALFMAYSEACLLAEGINQVTDVF